MAASKIEWTDATWNPITGCSKISPGCANCYAERFSKRLQAMHIKKYSKGFAVTSHPSSLYAPLNWKKPRMVFVNSMSDLFHEDINIDFIQQVFEVMRIAHWHQFQVLTKRSERLIQLSPQIEWPENVWMGVSVENKDYKYRIDHLRQTNAHIKFLSLEPLLGPLNRLNLENIDWVIVGGESGPGARPMLKEWVLDIKNQALSSQVPFFFKQWGGINKKETGRKLEGKTWDETPYYHSYST